jgi:serine/threonine-protein kinase HipA
VTTASAHVYVDLVGALHLVGRLWTTSAKGRETATFEYDDAWLAAPEHFALEPSLALGPGPFHTGAGRAIFGALGDSAPDRWGRTLMARAERRRAAAESRRPRTLLEIDYLLGVNDEARQGALRFALTEGGPFVAEASSNPVPPLVQLARLLAATDHVLDDDETDEDLRLLLAPGSSLGGARPKASVRDKDGSLLVAKFPAKTDEVNVVRWEALALSLARRAGIVVPDWRLESVADRDVLLVRRFDRAGNTRIPFLSALSMLGAGDREMRSYLEIADTLRMHGAAVGEDLPALWRRVVFNVLISNTDDHLRNHGFLYTGSDGWRLSPAYDLNPVPVDIKPRVLSTAIGLDDDPTASLELALEVAGDFAVSESNSMAIAGGVGQAVARWRDEAAALGIPPNEVERMSSAFEHEDLEAALAA